MSEAPSVEKTAALRREARLPSPAQRALYVLEYALFRTIMALFWALGLEVGSKFGGWVARTFGPKIPVTRRARRNMARALPELDEAAREKAIADMWENLGRTFAEYPHLDKIWGIKPGARIEIVGLDRAEAEVAKGKGAIFVSGHCGNWETMPGVIADYGLKGTLVYRAPNNPYVDAWISARRQSRLPIVAAKGADGARMILKTLKEGRLLAMLIDQKLNDGIAVPFFGRDAMTAPAAAHLSLRHGAPIIFGWCTRLPNCHFRVSVDEVIQPQPTGNHVKDVYDLTLKLNQALEAHIRREPWNWLWLHNRWPKN